MHFRVPVCGRGRKEGDKGSHHLPLGSKGSVGGGKGDRLSQVLSDTHSCLLLALGDSPETLGWAATGNLGAALPGPRSL